MDKNLSFGPLRLGDFSVSLVAAAESGENVISAMEDDFVMALIADLGKHSTVDSIPQR